MTGGIKKVKDKINSGLKMIYYKYIKMTVYCDLLILDDIYPQPLSGFRLAEFSCYLDHFNALVLSTGRAFPLLKEYRSFYEVRRVHYEKYKNHIGKLYEYSPYFKVKAKLMYFVFLSNGVNFLDFIEKNKTPFAFTLYPGGGLRLGEEETNIALKRIFSSVYFKYVIVTQKHVFEYLKTNHLCDESQIKLIPGSPGSVSDNVDLLSKKQYYPKDKATFDICFVAGKYSTEGKDKGYDTFVYVAKKLHAIHKNIRFHVGGGFNKDDIDVSSLGDNIHFYGFLDTKQLHELYIKMDVILSPNISNILFKGAFDGFPLGCVQEAGGCEVLMMCYDDLNQNISFNNGEDMIILDQNPDLIVDKIVYLYDNPKVMYGIAKRGREVVLDIASFEKQLEPRINLIKSFVK